MLSRLLRRARVVAANSRRCRADLAAAAPEAGRARVVYLGAEASEPRPREDFVLCAARKAAHKGQDVLLLAWRALAEAGLEIPLVLCGADHWRGSVGRLSRKLGLERLVTDLGPVPRARARDLISRARFVVAPSRVEGLGLSAVEALAAGTPVLASRVGGLPEVVRHGREGLLVAPKDPAALARAARRLWEDGRLRGRLSAGARRRAALFSWERAAEDLARLGGLRPGARVAVVVWQDGSDHTALALRDGAASALRALGYRPLARAAADSSALSGLAAARPDAWLVFLLRYRTVGVPARFVERNGIRPVVVLC